MEYQELVDFLRMERFRRRWTQRHLSTVSGLDTNTIGRLEGLRDVKNGHRGPAAKPRVETFLIWIEALGYEIELKPRGGNNEPPKKGT